MFYKSPKMGVGHICLGHPLGTVWNSDPLVGLLWNFWLAPVVMQMAQCLVDCKVIWWCWKKVFQIGDKRLLLFDAFCIWRCLMTFLSKACWDVVYFLEYSNCLSHSFREHLLGSQHCALGVPQFTPQDSWPRLRRIWSSASQQAHMLHF